MINNQAHNCYSELPLIDLSVLVNSEVKSAKYIDQCNIINRSCQSNGAFFITGYEAVSSLDLDGVFAEAFDFFDLPLESKQEYIASAQNDYLGYRGIGSEFSELKHRLPEQVEQYKFGYLYDKKSQVTSLQLNSFQICNNSIFKKHTKTCFHSLEKLGLSVLSIIASSLNLNKDHFDSYFSHPTHQMALNCYPAQLKVGSENKETYGMTEHKDLSLITIIGQNKAGLMLKNAKGEWIKVPQIPNTFLIILGEYLERWSDNYYIAPLHQVLESSNERRVSIVYKVRPDYETVIPVIENINPYSKGASRSEFHTGKAYDAKLDYIMYINDKNKSN